ncbi:MAG: hypothetical protein RIS70_1321, partial [Planctomycetota bacterium]
MKTRAGNEPEFEGVTVDLSMLRTLARFARRHAKAASVATMALAVGTGTLPVGIGLFGMGTGSVPFGKTAVAEDRESLRQKQQLHDKARVLARELVTSVLDVQLRQLRENGLENEQVFGDIRDMRSHIDRLVKDQMETVVELLVKAQEGSQAERLQNFNEARDKTREVVVQLMSERQRLYRRLQIAKLSAQVQQLISMETKVYNTTRALPDQPKEQRETRLVKTLGDQDDVGAIYGQLVDTLKDLTGWSGTVAAGASDGLRLLKVARVDEELAAVRQTLGSSQFDQAQARELAVIKGLRALLEKLEETQGLISSDREAAIKLVQEMMKKQAELREETRKTELTEQAVQELVAKQEEIHRQISELSQALTKYPTAEPLAQQAKESAVTASNELFEQDKPQALSEQSKVLGSLAQIEEQLKRAVQTDQANKSADQLAAEVKQLQQLQNDLGEALKSQEQAAANATAKPAEAKQLEKQTADTLAKSDAMENLPNVIASRLQDAKEAVAEAQNAMNAAAPEQAPARNAAAEKAEDALRQAAAEVASQLADTQRRELAVKVGELARAAEALERAAAAEQHVADESSRAAKTDGLTAADAKQLAQEQSDVAAVANKIAEGIQQTAPDVAKELAEAMAPIQ